MPTCPNAISQRGDEPVYDLTPSAAKAMEWIADLKPKPFVGTESRLLTVFNLLREISSKASDSPERRIQELERSKGEHFWARGYFVSTVGRDEEVIRNYIRRQEDEDRRVDQLKLAQLAAFRRPKVYGNRFERFTDKAPAWPGDTYKINLKKCCFEHSM
jgi:hypothetical protein